MKSIKVMSIDNGQPLFDKPIKELFKDCVVGSVLRIMTPAEHISYQQIKWWKGVLLPALSENGESVFTWETRLKIAIMPDEFKPEIIVVNNKECVMIPSIRDLGIKKMNQLIEGSVTYCQNILGLDWVKLPDINLRKG
jgi:hypothetical protein